MSILDITSIIGTISCAMSGTLVAIQKHMDLFGVNMLAITTAVGGGIMRDLMIGDTPPVMFRDPLYVAIAFIVANLLFIFHYFKKKKPSDSTVRKYDRLLFIPDAIGLAAFTVNGVIIGMNYDSANFFLSVFLGVITGVGGGILRDIMAQELPSIFVKRIYAVASIIGAIGVSVLWQYNETVAIATGFVLIILVRVLAGIFKWNLPVIK